MELIFATANPGKVREARQICDALGKKYGVAVSVVPMQDKVDIVEDGADYAANSEIKARYVWNRYHKCCIADDSGLEVEALDGAPGLYTARYCGHNFQNGIDKLLHEMQERGALEPSRRRARFVCDITLMTGDGVHHFEGVCDGCISLERRGDCGFGFDPVFIPDVCPGKCMAELEEEVKNLISHRGLALEEMFKYLKDNE